MKNLVTERNEDWDQSNLDCLQPSGPAPHCSHYCVYAVLFLSIFSFFCRFLRIPEAWDQSAAPASAGPRQVFMWRFVGVAARCSLSPTDTRSDLTHSSSSSLLLLSASEPPRREKLCRLTMWARLFVFSFFFFLSQLNHENLHRFPSSSSALTKSCTRVRSVHGRQPLLPVWVLQLVLSHWFCRTDNSAWIWQSADREAHYCTRRFHVCAVDTYIFFLRPYSWITSGIINLFSADKIFISLFKICFFFPPSYSGGGGV